MKITKSQLKQIIKEEMEEEPRPEEKNAVAAALLDFVMQEPNFKNQANKLCVDYTFDRTKAGYIVEAARFEYGTAWLKGKNVKTNEPLDGYTVSGYNPKTEFSDIPLSQIFYLIPFEPLIKGEVTMRVEYPTGKRGVWVPYAYTMYAPALQAWFEETQPAGLMQLGTLGYLRKQLEGSFDPEAYEELKEPLKDQSPSDNVYSLSTALRSASGLDQEIVKAVLKNLESIQLGRFGADGLDRARQLAKMAGRRRKLGPSRPPGITSHPGGGMGGGMRFEGKMKITKAQLKQIIKEELDESWERYEFDDEGEHTATRRSARSREQRRWDKMKQAKAARDRWQQEDPEAYEAYAAEKAREREEWLARQRDPELNRQIMVNVIKDLIRNGTPPGAIMTKPGIVKAALDSLDQEQASEAESADPSYDTPEM